MDTSRASSLWYLELRILERGLRCCRTCITGLPLHLKITFLQHSLLSGTSLRGLCFSEGESSIFSEPYCVKTIAERKRRPNILSRLNFKQAMVLPKSSLSWRIWWALLSVGCFERQPQCSSPSCSQVPMVRIFSKRGRSTASSTLSWLRIPAPSRWSSTKSTSSTIPK